VCWSKSRTLLRASPYRAPSPVQVRSSSRSSMPGKWHRSFLLQAATLLTVLRFNGVFVWLINQGGSGEPQDVTGPVSTRDGLSQDPHRAPVQDGLATSGTSLRSSAVATVLAVSAVAVASSSSDVRFPKGARRSMR